MPPTLLQRNVIVPHFDINPYQVKYGDGKSSTGIEYVINYIKGESEKNTLESKFYVLKSGTGSGKSSALPPALIKSRSRTIGITEPTRAVVEDVPGEIIRWNPDVLMGENIGFQTSTIKMTTLKGMYFMTPQVLLNQLQMDTRAFMKKYSTIIIDEVHMHSTTIDFLLRSLKLLISDNYQKAECPIVIVMSATLDPKKYMDYFDTKHFLEIKGADSAPIKEVWPKTDIVDLNKHILSLVKNIQNDKKEMDILIFAATQKAMENIQKVLIAGKIKADTIALYHSKIPKTQVHKEVATKPGKRVLIGTNSVETGVTFEYLTSIIDTGYVFEVITDPQMACMVLNATVVPKASAIQRRGRVGRIRSGTWYPMYTKETHSALIPDKKPEVFTGDVSMQLLKFIIQITETELVNYREIKRNPKKTFDPLKLDLIHTPTSEMLQYTLEKLYTLGCLDINWEPTLQGVIVAKSQLLQVEQMKAILSSWYWDCEPMYMIIIMSCLMYQKDLFDPKFKEFKQTAEHKKFSSIINDEFVELLIKYYEFKENLDRIVNKPESNHIAALQKWCTENGYNYDIWVAVLELIADTTTQFLSVGLAAPATAISILDRYKKNSKDAIQAVMNIKKCLVEAYRFNIATWDSKQNAYIVRYKNKKLKPPRSPVLSAVHDPKGTTKYKPPIYILTDTILYINGAFTVGKVSVLDGFVDVDLNFLY